MGHQWFFPIIFIWETNGFNCKSPLKNNRQPKTTRPQKRAGGKAARGLVGSWFLGSLHGKITSTYLSQKGDLPITIC